MIINFNITLVFLKTKLRLLIICRLKMFTKIYVYINRSILYLRKTAKLDIT